MALKDYLRIGNATCLSRVEVDRLGTPILLVVAVMVFTGARFRFSRSDLPIRAARHAPAMTGLS